MRNIKESKIQNNSGLRCSDF